MGYEKPGDQAAHVTLTNAIMYERKAIAQHYRIIEQLQKRILCLGTEDEQLANRLKIRSAVIDINNED